ncbi:Uncharacterized protein dnl_23870 [Desulfonema limicola]|uniref:Uncharacterized protein n=1 Tax=Desulfonema limicola TaxID=45656 RepID=A0A975GGA2_9BACT|nr:Uncharacterized protein dnl_23870 [Desulfonema limicola]
MKDMSAQLFWQKLLFLMPDILIFEKCCIYLNLIFINATF